MKKKEKTVMVTKVLSIGGCRRNAMVMMVAPSKTPKTRIVVQNRHDEVD